MAQNGQSRKMLALAAGFGIGGLWVVLALWCIYSAMEGFANQRPDYGMSWGLVGFFLLAAGGSALVGTWWHVLREPHPDH